MSYISPKQQDFLSLFTEAFSPMSLDKDGLSGLSCTIAASKVDTQKISESIDAAFKESVTPDRLRKISETISKKTGYFRTIKSVMALLYTPTKDSDQQIVAAHDTISRGLRALCGNDIELMISVYVNPLIKTSMLLLIVGGGVTVDLAQAFQAYVGHAFLGGDPQSEKDFNILFRRNLAEIREIRSVDERDKILRTFGGEWKNHIRSDAQREIISHQE